MDVLVLIKNNIKYKKGSFTSIIILMMIISLSVTAIVSLKKNFPDSIRAAYERVYDGNITLNICDRFLTSDMVDEVAEHPLVKKVEVLKALSPDGFKFSNGKEGNNGIMIMQINERVDRFWNEEGSGFLEEIPDIGKGEVCLPRALAEDSGVHIGDSITFSFGEDSYSFVIRGLIEEPVCGSTFIGLKVPFISKEDFEELYAERKVIVESSQELLYDLYDIVYISQADDSDLSDSRFAAVLNNDTEMGSFASGILTKSESLYYQGIMPDITLNIFLAFVIILTVIVFVVMSNSISSSVELNYTDLGILKAQGFDAGRLKLVFLGQYMLAEIIGVVVGFLLAVPLVTYLPRVYEPLIGIKIYGGVDILLSAAILLGLLILSAAFIMLISEKVGRISPIRAVSSGRSEVYFDSRLNVPVRGRFLSASIALRQFTSGKKRYLASIAIASLIVFFLLTTTGMTDATTSDNAQRAMGATSENVAIAVPVEYSPENTEYVNKQFELTECVIREYSDYTERYRLATKYMLLDGQNVACRISEDDEGFVITKGRVPRYDNEIVVGQLFAEDMGYGIGDKLKVAYRGKEGEFIVTGFCAGLIDTGRFFGMTGDGARTLIDDFSVHWAGYKIKNPDPDVLDQIEERLKRELPEDCSVDIYEPGTSSDVFKQMAAAIKAVIYIISIFFALVVVSMVCTKTFVREKTDIGIYKALGFTSANLRMQFAMRFLIIAFFGIIIGTTLSLAFSEQLLSYLLRSMGIVNFVIDYRFITVFLPVVAVALSYFCFAYMVAGKVKKVEVRNLITE